jgi:hypothetical protein
LRHTRRHFIKAGAVGLIAGSLFGNAAPAAAQRKGRDPAGGTRMKGPIFNQDSTEFFYTHTPDQISGEAVDAWVDSLAEAGVGTLVSNTCAMRANYASRVWEPDWHGYDPDGPDDQPVLKHLPPESIAGTRRRLDSAKRLADMGINFHERAFARCRKHGIGAWASVRMNDLHDCHLEDSPLLSTFYKSHPELRRVPYRFTGWPDRALDWSHPEVHDHYMKLVLEILDFDGLEGIELDWMRFGYHFGIGREIEGGKLLAEFIRKVRTECGKRGKKLGVRVPSTPETARNLGLDGAAWAMEGLIDLLVPTPFWATCEFDMPMATWRKLVEGTGCELAGGLEVRYQPHRGAAARTMTPELARGAAMAVLAGGADHVYLFNYFATMHLGGQWSKGDYDATVGAMRGIEQLGKLPRRHAVTYRDVRAPGEPEDDPLPATGAILPFRLQTGPKPVGRAVSALIELQPGEQEVAAPSLRVNGTPCAEGEKQEGAALVYAVPPAALANGVTVVEATAADGRPITIARVELAIDAPPQ